MSYAAEQLKSSLTTASNAVEEALQMLGDAPYLGDDGVAEAIVHAENALSLARQKVEKREPHVPDEPVRCTVGCTGPWHRPDCALRGHVRYSA